MLKIFSDQTGDLDKRVTQAAEYVYGQSQPVLWTAYLASNDRNDEAICFAQSAYVQVDFSERPCVLNNWANAIAGMALRDLIVAQHEVQMHDGEAAALRLTTTPVNATNLADVAPAAIDRALIAEERADLPTAATESDSVAAAYADPRISTSNPQYICFAAVTYQKTGQPKKADAALTPYGNGTSVDCYRFGGDVLDLRGDWSGAQAWCARSVKLGPSIPSGYDSGDMALARHGDLDGAAAKFTAAN